MDDFGAQISDSLARQREAKIVSFLGLEFRQDIRVRVRKPRWMPRRVYLALMRTVVVEEGPLLIGKPPRLDMDLKPPRTDGFMFK